MVSALFLCTWKGDAARDGTREKFTRTRAERMLRWRDRTTEKRDKKGVGDTKPPNVTAREQVGEKRGNNSKDERYRRQKQKEETKSNTGERKKLGGTVGGKGGSGPTEKENGSTHRVVSARTHHGKRDTLTNSTTRSIK